MRGATSAFSLSGNNLPQTQQLCLSGQSGKFRRDNRYSNGSLISLMDREPCTQVIACRSNWDES